MSDGLDKSLPNGASQLLVLFLRKADFVSVLLL